MRPIRSSANPYPRGRLTGGFTLIELMIVVLIMAILAGIGFPSYTQYILRGKRSEARAFLMDSAAKLERYYSDNNKYATADDTLPPGINDTSETGKYTLTIATTGTYQAYVLTATPTFGGGDPLCGALTLANTGLKGEGGTATDINDCWGK